MDLSIRIGSLVLRNPVIAASGCFGYGVEYAHAVNLASLGGVAVKGLFLAEREGHAPPRIVGADNALRNHWHRRLVDQPLKRLPGERGIDVDVVDALMRLRVVAEDDGRRCADQSRWFDNAMTRYFARKEWGVAQFSILRPLSELLILRILVERYPNLQQHQMSCHAAHRDREHGAAMSVDHARGRR